MKLRILTILTLAVVMLSCGDDKAKKTEVATPAKEEVKVEEKATPVAVDPMTDKGVGPIKNLTLGDLDAALVTKGEGIYKSKCTACHKISKRFVGPGLKGITAKRTPEWIMNMILNPEVMVVENEAAKQLLIEYSAPMANQSLTEEEARAILEYLRTKN